MAASPMTLIQPNRTTSDPERDALVLRRIPPRRERRSDGEGGPGHAQHNADRENAGKAVDPNEPGQQQSRHDGHLADQAGELLLDVVDMMPAGTRSSAPARIGTATMRPFWPALSPRSVAI